MKKGQGAMEYLMTYGWALLVIVVAGAALFALGILNPSTYAQKRCQGFQYFTYQDQQATPTHFILDTMNGPRDITITGLSINQAAVANLTSTPVGTKAGGSRFTVEGDFVGVASGQAYSYTVAVTYNVAGGIQGNVDRGTCTGTSV